jgi:uncharacterized membrane protein (UPF0127 family)
MNYSSNDEARYWAENLAASEDEAFEQVIERIKPDVVKECKNVLEQVIELSKNVIQRLTVENAELRDTVKIQSEQIKRLRECIARNQEEFYE